MLLSGDDRPDQRSGVPAVPVVLGNRKIVDQEDFRSARRHDASHRLTVYEPEVDVMSLDEVPSALSKNQGV